MSDPLTLMQSILDAYHTWKEAPTVDNWIVLDRALDRAAKLLQEVEMKLHPQEGKNERTR